jgi:hypothetical protein
MATEATQLRKFGRPISFANRMLELTEPVYSFHVLNTHVETSIGLSELIEKLELIVQSDVIPYKMVGPPFKFISYSLVFKQENAVDFQSELDDETGCTTSINITKKREVDGVFLVEVVRLNGNRALFRNTWREIEKAFK